MPKSEHVAIWRRIVPAGLLGAAVTLALSTVLTAALSALISSGRVGEGAGTAVVLVSAFIACGIGTLLAVRRSGCAAMLTGIAAAGCSALLRLLVMLCCGRMTIDTLDAAVLAIFLCAGLAVGAIRPSKRRRRR